MPNALVLRPWTFFCNFLWCHLVFEINENSDKRGRWRNTKIIGEGDGDAAKKEYGTLCSVQQSQQGLKSPLKVRLMASVDSGISVRKYSAELTQNGFHYSVEESAHSEAFRSLRKSQFWSSQENGIPWKIWFDKKSCSRKQNWKCVFVGEMLWNGIPRVCFHFCPRNGILSWFLFHRMVQNRIPSGCFYFCSTERNSELFSLPQNVSTFVPHTEFRAFFSSEEWKRNPRVFCTVEQPEFRQNKPIVSSIPSSTEKCFCWKCQPYTRRPVLKLADFFCWHPLNVQNTHLLFYNPWRIFSVATSLVTVVGID